MRHECKQSHEPPDVLGGVLVKRGDCEELVARVAVDPRDTARQQIRQRIECRQRRRLRTIERILNHRA
jgi:hypothetical protein